MSTLLYLHDLATSIAPAFSDVLAADDPKAPSLPTQNIISLIVKNVVPVICVVVGLSIMWKAKEGKKMGDATTTGAVVLIGAAIMALGGVAFAFGDTIVKAALG